ncbi:hypothetical protein [Turkeypox virus]|uniref:Uncharacterized protein n=1 Tax=Turkeypox virus TaxID=336486 RepID=A0A0M3ZHV4_9POXV|nr:hypothetical protein ASN15_gp075 [Turkeypox virus]ALA62449.1 hypothetical protein [Turkeypox virus]
MFKNYKYKPLNNDKYNNEIPLLIPGLEDNNLIDSNDKVFNTNTFKEQVLKIVKEYYGCMYSQLNMLSSCIKYDDDILYRIINSDPAVRYKFFIDYYDDVFGSFNRSHEFIHDTVVKIYNNNNESIYIVVINGEKILEKKLNTESAGYIESIYYNIKFDKIVKLKLYNINMYFIGKFILLKDRVFMLSSNCKIVSNEKDFLLEVYG